MVRRAAGSPTYIYRRRLDPAGAPVAEAKLDAAHAEVLSEVPLLRMATLSPRGDPHVAPVRFHFDGVSLYVAAPAGSEPMANLRANRRVALLAERDQALRGFVLQGLSSPVRSQTESARVWEALEAKYPDLPSEEVQGSLVKVTPLRILDLGGGP